MKKTEDHLDIFVSDTAVMEISFRVVVSYSQFFDTLGYDEPAISIPISLGLTEPLTV